MRLRASGFLQVTMNHALHAGTKSNWERLISFLEDGVKLIHLQIHVAIQVLHEGTFALDDACNPPLAAISKQMKRTVWIANGCRRERDILFLFTRQNLVSHGSDHRAWY